MEKRICNWFVAMTGWTIDQKRGSWMRMDLEKNVKGDLPERKVVTTT